MTSGAVPQSVSELDAAVMEALIADMHPGTTVTDFELTEVRVRGEMVSTAGRARARLSYGPGSPKLPENVVIKMLMDDVGISPVLYDTEAQIYRQVLPQLDIEKPFCLASAFDPSSGAFILVLEDLSLKNAFFPNVLEPPLTPAAVGELLDLLATVHARYWNSPKLDDYSSWLCRLTTGPQFDFFEEFTVPAIDSYVAEMPYRADLITRVGRSPARLWENVKGVHRHHERTLPLTLQHGDTGAHNSYHLPDGRRGYLDWQLSVRAAWPHDVHYLICTALSVADRRAHEKALVERYLARLRALGVDYAPPIDVAMREFGRAIIWGFTIGWLLVPAQNYPAVITNANIERLFAAVTDHGTLALADEVTETA